MNRCSGGKRLHGSTKNRGRGGAWDHMWWRVSAWTTQVWQRVRYYVLCVCEALWACIRECIHRDETEVFGFTFRFCDFWLIFFSILAVRCWLCCCFPFVNAPVDVWLQRKCRENWNLNRNKIGEKEWDRDRRNLLKFFVLIVLLSSLIIESLHFFEFFWVFFSVFWWDFRVFSLWVGDGGKGREMREAREDFLSARCNESGNRILYLRVGGYL